MIAISKLTFLYNYHPVLSEIPHQVSLWRTRGACCALDITTLPFSRQTIEYPVNLLFILDCETGNHPMGRTRENKALPLWHMCGWRFSTNINCRTSWMVLKTGLIQSSAHGRNQNTRNHKFYVAFETALFHYFQVPRGHIFMLSSADLKPGNHVLNPEIFQLVTGIIAAAVGIKYCGSCH